MYADDELEPFLLRTLRAGVRALWLHSDEEPHILRTIEEIGSVLQREVHTWSASQGVDGSRKERSLAPLLEALSRRDDPSIWILLEPGPSLRDPAARRALRECCQRTRGPSLLAIESPDEASLSLPELRHIELGAPSLSALLTVLDEICPDHEAQPPPHLAALYRSHGETLARAALGLSRHHFRDLLREASLDWDPEASVATSLEKILRAITHAKPGLLGPRGLLEELSSRPLSELGGLENLKSWLRSRALALDPSAREAAIPWPRGLLLLGVQGCGKSLAARCSADALGLPLLRLDPGRLFGGTVGESEANLRALTRSAEAMAPVVLWLDEIDKTLAGVDGSASDAGTTARVIGSFLTWLQERQRPVFVVATANRIAGLPPELLRRGRLDEIFFVDLPSAEERERILRIHLLEKPERELGRAPALADPWENFASIARNADFFSGAELESALVEARLEAFARKETLRASDFQRALTATVPLAKSHRESVETLREWAKTRARPA